MAQRELQGEALVTRPLLAAGCRLCLSHSVVAGLGNSADSAAPLKLSSGLGCSAQSVKGGLLLAEVRVRMLRQRLFHLAARGSCQREVLRGVNKQLGDLSIPRLCSSGPSGGQEAIGVVQSLVDTHNQTVSSLVSEKLAGKFVQQYRAMAEADRAQLLLHLATSHGVPYY